MSLINHQQRPWHITSFGFAIVLFVSFHFESSLAEYDCSAKDDGWYYDPDFCHIYWRCIHGASEEFECASGTAWDHHENRCNWIDNIDCSRGEKTTPKLVDHDTEDDYGTDVEGGSKSNRGNDGEDEDAEDRPTVVKKSKKKKNRKLNSNKRMLDGHRTLAIDTNDLYLLIISPASTSNDFLCSNQDGFFPDTEYCTKYYRCSHGNTEVFECPRGTAWDENVKSCAWVDQVNCENKTLGYSTSTATMIEETTATNKKSDLNPIASEINTISSNNDKGSDDNSPLIECQPTGIYSVADPAECNSYFQCNKGVRTKLNCPEKQSFDVDKRECNEYERVNCGTRAVSLSDKNQCINKRDGIYPDVERDCRFYYQCMAQNKMREGKCSGDQKFNSNTVRCGPPNSAPAPCGNYVPGNGGMNWHIDCFIHIIFMILLIFIFDF